jgi:hypothetical protein
MKRIRLIPHHLQLHNRTMLGRIEDVAWRLPDDLSEDEWIDSGIVLARVGAGVMWWVGDWWIYGENHYGDRKAIVQDPNWRGPCFQTCANAASVCRAFRTSRRREVLSFVHHAEVAALDMKEADRLLDWAQATIATTGKPRSTKDLRREVRQSRARLRGASIPTVVADVAKLEQELSHKYAYIAELEAAHDQEPTIKQLMDALVARAAGKPDSEIAQIVAEVTNRLNALKRVKAPNARMPVPKARAQDRTPARGNRAGDAHPLIKNGKKHRTSRRREISNARQKQCAQTPSKRRPSCST